MNVRFKEWECDLKLGQYENGRTALQLYDSREGDLVATATVNLTAVDDEAFTALAEAFECEEKDLLFIKDWSENEGMRQALTLAGVITSGKRIPTGFVHADICVLRRENIS